MGHPGDFKVLPGRILEPKVLASVPVSAEFTLRRFDIYGPTLATGLRAFQAEEAREST